MSSSADLRVRHGDLDRTVDVESVHWSALRSGLIGMTLAAMRDSRSSGWC